jgi:hypothetical protein
MNYKSIKFPSEFVEEAKFCADSQYRSTSGQIIYWAKLGKQLAEIAVSDNNDRALLKIVFDRYKKEKHLAKLVKIDDL